MPEMDGKTRKTNVDAMDIDLGFDALNNSKRVRRSSKGDDSVEPSARKDDLVEAIDTSSPYLGMRPWKPMNGHRGNFARGNSTNQSWKPKSSNFTSNSLEQGYSIVDQKRVGNEDAKNEVIITSDGGISFPFQQNDMRIKGKEVESKGNHRQNFPVMGSSLSNKSMMRQPDEIASSSKNDKEVYSYSDTGFKSRMKGNVIFCGSDLQGKVDEVLSKPSYIYSPGINAGQSKAISKENVEKIVYIDLSEGVSSHEINSNRLHSDKKTGKLNLEDHTPNDMQHVEPTIQPSRAASLLGKEVVTSSEEQGSSFVFYQNLGCRKARDFNINMNQLSHAYPSNYKEKLSSSCLPEWRQETDIQDKSHERSICKRNHSWKRHVKGKKKCNSLLSFEETSGSILNQPSYPQSHAGASSLKLDKRNKNSWSSHGKHSGVSDNSIASASQIESDEILARELQEKFYHETTRFIDMEKVDETIAWSMQQDEDAKADALALRDHSNSVLFDEISSNYDSEVDLETRLDLLEAMEDELENNMLEYDDIASYDSFNYTDYEMQFNLDESNHQHASSSEINNLPLSLIQNDNNKEACAVCLEIPSVGETMRHLPCLHKFHKMCIDTWLRRKPLCPVCKFSVTLI